MNLKSPSRTHYRAKVVDSTDFPKVKEMKKKISDIVQCIYHQRSIIPYRPDYYRFRNEKGIIYWWNGMPTPIIREGHRYKIDAVIRNECKKLRRISHCRVREVF